LLLCIKSHTEACCKSADYLKDPFMINWNSKNNHIMRTNILAASALATAIISGTAFAQTPKAEDDHSAHHPAGSASAASASVPSAMPSPEAFNQQMKAMQDMHQKMQAAKTPAERAKLMEDHMQTMQSGMAMMSQMRGGASGMGGMSGMSGSTSGSMGVMPPSAQGSTGQSQARSNSGMGGMMNMHMQMERRMAMMEQMMQMMIDRDAGVPRK
jgi:hypothetical protein